MTRRRAVALIAVGLAAALPSASAGQPVSGATIWTIAGSGSTFLDGGFFGDGGPATAAELLEPTGVALDRAGNLYIADAANERIRRVSPTGTITTIAGDGQSGFSGDGGPAVQARFDSPISVAVDASGGVLVADQNNNRVRRIDPSGMITTIAGDGVKGFDGDGGPATGAELSAPVGVAVDARGGLLIADQDNNRVRRVDGTGTITTIAGDGAPAFAGDGGPATSASLHGPTGVAADPRGGVLVADAGNNRVRRIDPSGTIATIAGDGTAGFAGDGGPALSARLNAPSGVTPDASGGILVADFNNNRVRRIDRSGMITTIAGNGIAGLAGDGGAAADASLNAPVTVAVDGAGDVAIADRNNDRVRWLTSLTQGAAGPPGHGGRPGAVGAMGPAGPNSRLAAAAFGVTVAGRAVVVRYALTGAAKVSLRVTPRRGPSRVVTTTNGAAGINVIRWNRRLGRTVAPPGRYTLTLLASVGSATTATSLVLRIQTRGHRRAPH